MAAFPIKGRRLDDGERRGWSSEVVEKFKEVKRGGTGEAEVNASLVRCSRLDASAGAYAGARHLLTLSLYG